MFSSMDENRHVGKLCVTQLPANGLSLLSADQTQVRTKLPSHL